MKTGISDSRLSRRTFVLGMLAGFVAPQANAQCAPIDLGIPNIRQDMSNWCWVAAAQQVIYWATGSAPPQCELVSFVARTHPQFVCTQPQRFNRPASFQPIAMLLQQFLGAYSSMNGPGSPQQVYQTIASRRSVIMLVYPSFSQVGHFVVLRGVSCYGTNLVFHINDPMNFSGFQTTNVPYAQVAQMWHSALVVG
ncbi:C39 family peptidase [Pseudovibrio sp. POLY-S9]|uniref:C39 family peptidase n=1 Tax=Pseudovibrio sp. POLY-S9 TaxID=1576596 RepID=UPI0009E97D15|nr:C39 family peptidase [Pseudovibrio sp. POLY-S9]